VTPGEALVAALVPGSRRDMVERAGGIGAAARILAGTPAGKLPETGTPERRAYTNARRNFEGARIDRKLTARMQARAAAWSIGKLRRRGAARSRVMVTYTVSKTTHAQIMPAGGPGVLLRSKAITKITTPFLAGDFERAGAVFEVEFLTVYWDPDAITIEDYVWVHLWPDGEDEPE
jgi:hypothetical protein